MYDNHTLLYLAEHETKAAGAGDIAKCVDIMAEVMRLVAEGDYLMGGPSRNQHGLRLYFPDNPAFPDMPSNGPDRRFMALAGYLGGRFRVCGAKWYGSNMENRQKGLPRSMHTIVLNDPETALPLCFMAGNTISTSRTGAMVGLGAKVLAKKGAHTLALIGVGSIGCAACGAVRAACPTVREVQVFSLTPASARRAASDITRRHGVAAMACDSLQQAIVGSDIVVYAASGPEKPELRRAWLAEGALVVFASECELEDACLSGCKWVADNWEMFDVYAHEHNGVSPGRQTDMARLLAGLVRDGQFARGAIGDLAPIVAGSAPGRVSEHETILLALDGMCVEDIAWAHTVYRNAQESGIGITLPYF